jgi:hypothetical protein
LINNSFFVKDAYKDPKTGKVATPSYKAEVAYVTDDLLVPDGIVDQAFAWAQEEFGADIYFDIDADTLAPEEKVGKSMIKTPFLAGSKLKAKREKKGKNGDAYDGKTVIRFNTLYNKDGIDAPGGIEVYNERVEPVGIVEGNQNEIYNGCEVIIRASFHSYGDLGDDDDPAGFKFYLKAAQKSGDGQRIRQQTSSAGAFAPLAAGGSGAAPSGARRGRKG